MNTGRMSRQKGNRGELKVAKLIANTLGFEEGHVRRTPNSGALIERSDLRLSDAALQKFPWWLEIKNRECWDLHPIFNGNPEKWEPYAWFREAEDKRARQIRTGFKGAEYPLLLVLLKNRREPLAMFEDIRRPPSFPHTYTPKITFDDSCGRLFHVVRFQDLLEAYKDLGE